MIPLFFPFDIICMETLEISFGSNISKQDVDVPDRAMQEKIAWL